MMKTETICALCTHPGKSALSLIRISGPKSLEITRKQAPFLPSKPESHRAYVGVLKKEGRHIDKVVLTYFAKGRSFTGEETLEITCHGGSSYNPILEGLLEDGARLAKKGEFSFQSFSNGQMDLVQAEGLYQMIESENETARQNSFHQLQGSFSKVLEAIEKPWLETLSHLEADIDFSLEDISTFDESKLEESLLGLQKQVGGLVEKYKPFEHLQRGLVCGLFGPVNSGKSTLFNSLVKEEKAITSSEEGTTRDVVESSLKNREGLNIQLKDTAGFRDTKSEGEKKGQDKTKTLLRASDLQIFVWDVLRDLKTNECPLPFTKKETSLFVFTKTDLSKSKLIKKSLIEKIKKAKPDWEKFLLAENVFLVSALKEEGVEELRQKILLFGETHGEDFFVTNYRHYKGLQVMEQSLKQSLRILKEQEGERDLMALELRQGLTALYKLLGKQMDDKVLDEIFEQFCIGK